jgi:hypothetical protein
MVEPLLPVSDKNTPPGLRTVSARIIQGQGLNNRYSASKWCNFAGSEVLAPDNRGIRGDKENQVFRPRTASLRRRGCQAGRHRQHRPQETALDPDLRLWVRTDRCLLPELGNGFAGKVFNRLAPAAVVRGRRSGAMPDRNRATPALICFGTTVAKPCQNPLGSSRWG